MTRSKAALLRWSIPVLACAIAASLACAPARPAATPEDLPFPDDAGDDVTLTDADGDPESDAGGDAEALERFASEAELRRWVVHQGELMADLMRARRSAAAAETSGAVADGQESITNNQEEGVDEGGIVKVHGEHLVVLRRGRLFSVRMGAEELEPVSMVDAYPPGRRPDAWYDEMLISGDTIVVVGYSYGARATELGVFDIDAAGAISHRRTWYLRSNDYYSSRNYASRLLGDRLVFYMPYNLIQHRWEGGQSRPSYTLPAIRPWSARPSDVGEDDWSEVIRATDIYRPIQQTRNPVLHTVVTCDLGGAELDCTARGVIGPGGRTFYVSSSAVYVWLHGGHPGEPPTEGGAQRSDAVAYRLPLDGSAPGALWVSGAPIDQFSFRESGDEHLNVLVRARSGGDGMWGAEVSSGDLALLRVPLAEFHRDGGEAGASRYTSLPRPEGWTAQNRFVGDHVLYGTGSGWGPPSRRREGRLFVHPFRGGRTTTVALPHGVDRIEAMGGAAVVVGASGRDLHFSAVELGEAVPTVAGLYVQEDAAQGELRSHGFFYRRVSDSEGVLGLPIRRGGSAGYEHLRRGSASILYLRVRDLAFTRLGALASSPRAGVNDRCLASCVDWYGNARPIFLRGRVFALLGYELVEGRLDDAGSLSEVRRTHFFRDRVRS